MGSATKSASPASAILTKAPIYRLNHIDDDRAKTLKTLLQQNHAVHAVLREPRLLLHNHVPHALGSSYLLGASSEQLHEIFAAEAPNLTGVDGGVVRNVINSENWREFIGQKQYTAAYVDYLDSEVDKNNGDWEKVAIEHLYSGDNMLLNGLCGGLGHPFIHLAYGYEFQSREVITEALSLGCTEYDYTHKFLDSPPPDNSTYKTRQLADVIANIQKDSRFDGYSEHAGFANIFALWANYESEVLGHWNALVVDDVPMQLKDWLHTAALLALSTAKSIGGYDFYLAHVLTVGHAIRILLPYIPERHRAATMRQYALFAIFVYLAQLRPKFESDESTSVNGDCDSWDDIYRKALASEWYKDVHWPKVTRALREVALVRNSDDEFYRKAAMEFVSGFNGWTGFGLGIDAIQ